MSDIRTIVPFYKLQNSSTLGHHLAVHGYYKVKFFVAQNFHEKLQNEIFTFCL